MPEITEAPKDLMESADPARAPRKRISNRFDMVLLALCCLSFLIYLMESESIRYLALHLGVHR